MIKEFIMATNLLFMIIGFAGLAVSFAANIYGYKAKEGATMHLSGVAAAISIAMILLGGM